MPLRQILKKKQKKGREQQIGKGLSAFKQEEVFARIFFVLKNGGRLREDCLAVVVGVDGTED